MKTIAELKEFYAKELWPKLLTLEQERKAVVKKIASLCLPAGLLGILLCLVFLSGDPQIPFFILFFTLFVLGGISVWCSRGFVSNFKDVIIASLVSFIEGGLVYRKAEYISEHEFKASQIFQHRADRYHGDDLVEGMVGQTAVRFSELHAQYRTQDSKGRTRYQTFFKGLFFIADFNKDFRSKTFVLPDTAERLLGGLGTMLQKMNVTRPPLVRLEDPEFEKIFAVYGDDQIEARYILSTSLMERIKSFKTKSKRTIYLSFIRSKVYIAIWYNRNLFEPKVFKTMLDFSPIQEYFEDLQLAIGIVEDLNLNVRIWSKQ